MIFETKIILSLDELREYLRISKSTAYRLVYEGSIHGYKVGGEWFFNHAEIDRWIEKRESECMSGKAIMPEHRKGRRARRFK
jgi:excisionase family DNA binding protein